VQGALNVLGGIAVLLGFIFLWYVGVRVFLWLMFAASSLVPYIGRRHRHARWDELNKLK
jgi:hypothetical protein